MAAERDRANAAEADRRAVEARAEVLHEQVEAMRAEVAKVQATLAAAEAEGAVADVQTAELTAQVKQARSLAQAAEQAADDLRSANEARRTAGLWVRLGRRGEANRMSDVPPPILSVILDAVRLIEVQMPEVRGLAELIWRYSQGVVLGDADRAELEAIAERVRRRQ